MRSLTRIIVLVVAAMLLGACSAGANWTYAPVSSADLASTATASAGSASSSADPAMAGMSAPGAPLGSLEIHAFDLGFKPASLTVAQPGTYTIKFVNDGAVTHNVTFNDGTSISADPKQTSTGVVSIPAAGISFLCSIPGHADAGMKGTITLASTAAAPAASPAADSPSSAAAPEQPDPNAAPYVERDPTAPAVASGSVHDVDFPIIDRDITVAAGYVVHAWTFGGTVPGPTIRVHLGDTVRVHLTNQTTMSHSIDFHASQTAMDDQMVEIKPGGSWTYTFKADYAGVWMYHCGTAPALHHIANGMFGMVIVEPKGGFAKVDKELAFVQSEWYLGGQGQPASYVKANAANPSPDFVVFNGVASQYKDNPIPVTAGDRIRIFVLNAGPNEDSSFHVVGTIFDTVIKEGIELQRGNAGGWGSQAVDLAPAQAAIIELTIPEKGMYAFVTHAFNFVGKGAIGMLKAS